MATTSSYIQLSEYALIEYIYNSDNLSTTSSRPLRLYNNYSKEYYFINNAQSLSITGNVLDNTAARMGRESTKWAYMDIDPVAPVINIDNNFSLNDLTSNLVTTIKYDKVKLHLLSGYDFPGLDGIILQIRWNEWNENGTGGRNFNAASQVYVKGEERINFNTNPLFVGDRLYDKYIEFLIPSLSEVNFDFWNSPSAPNTFGFNYTFNNVGFSENSQITAQLFEIDTTINERGNRYFITGESYTTSFNSNDIYSYISAVVSENADNDYIEYYPTWNGQFIEDYIPVLNSNGGDWVVVNQLEVNEQIGTMMVNTYSLTSLQDTNLNQPAVFRPIIRNASLAVSFTIIYTMRLMNRANGQEIIRQATFTSFNPKKYGEKLNRINVLEGFRPMKVYNKIVKVSESDITQSVQYVGAPTVITQNVYVNSYYDVNMISIDSTNNINEKLGGTVWQQGENVLFLSKFDNYVKFKIYTKSADKKQNISLDLSSTGLNTKLAFIYDDQSKIYIDPILNQNAADLGAGEIMFRIDDSVSIKLLAGKNRDYYIVNKNDNGDEVLMYNGTFADQKEKQSILTNKKNNTIAELEKQISSLNLTLDLLKQQVSTASVTGTNNIVNAIPGTGGITGTQSTGNISIDKTQAEKISEAQNAQTFASSVEQGTKSALIKAANTGDTKQLNLVEVPGLNSNRGSNINNAITPSVIKPGKPSTQIKKQDVTSSALKKENDNI